MSTSSMDVEEQQNSSSVVAECNVAVHPLAIVSMSDQYTRITMGGSPLEATANVMGLLFGRYHNNSDNTTSGGTTSLIQITDAEDVPLETKTAAETQVSLHKTVFPQNSVVGWYRVVLESNNSNNKDEEFLSPQDLVLSKQLQESYQDKDSNGIPFIFTLLQVKTSSTSSKNTSSNNNGKTNGSSGDDELPLTVYALHDDVLVSVPKERWILDTATAERIAVERVMREQPSGSQQHQQALPTLNPQVQQYQESLTALQDRLMIMESFLSDINSNNNITSEKLYLLRQIQASLLQQPFMYDDDENNNNNDAGGTSSSSNKNYLRQSVQPLNELAKTTLAIQQYTDKVRTIDRVGGGGTTTTTTTTSSDGGSVAAAAASAAAARGAMFAYAK